MSYIRAGSNPEALYIVGGDRNRVEVYAHRVRGLTSKTLPENSWALPAKAFNRVLALWAEGYRDRASCGGIVVEEVFVFTDTGKLVPEVKHPMTRRALKRYINGSRERRFVIRLSYKGDYICMWPVTWQYIVSVNAHRADTGKCIQCGRLNAKAKKRKV